MHLLIFNKVLCNILIDIFFRHPSLILNVIILIEPDVNPFGVSQYFRCNVLYPDENAVNTFNE